VLGLRLVWLGLGLAIVIAPSAGPFMLGLLDNSRIRQLADCQLVDWMTRGLDNSHTGQVADWTARGCHQRLCVLSFPVCRHLRDRELSSPRVD